MNKLFQRYLTKKPARINSDYTVTLIIKDFRWIYNLQAANVSPRCSFFSAVDLIYQYVITLYLSTNDKTQIDISAAIILTTFPATLIILQPLLDDGKQFIHSSLCPPQSLKFPITFVN